ncbi:MAG: ParA family protein [Microcystis aeruginosa LL13-03]|nr:ParA family protein [Microcystis aeruginosa LL13-03]NCR47330.1 ParA family protein [Microcystis aeruginosa SX13-01]NCR69296.1 ParA family protein [Microcystis aeruginosa LL11-07]NCR91659.1 ParA family protein [Microcystis aeruginosa G13-10]NCS18247.1 ParA family protein [Microcystis aeruginosa G13-12]NCS22778.1 ParA family protein [Microcystis aeruginosa G11-06]NCS36889.1 ParA family protein [Microcystis aeruginosa G11-01]NCT53847.1 ParA family protein [Microcystis aeruginosa G13-03]NCT6
MKIITVTGYKGGVGKSTTAVHIATYFSDRGRTVLVDGDPNRTALGWAERGRVDSFKLSTADFESINLTEDSQVYLSLTKRVSHNN